MNNMRLISRKNPFNQKSKNIVMNNLGEEYYWIGEFGYFNLNILSFLETYNMELTIHTYPDNCYIISNMFPNRFILNEIPLNMLRNGDTLRKINSQTYNTNNMISLSSFVNGDPVNDINYNFTYLTKQISTIYNEDIDNFICYFPRYRYYNGISKNDNWIARNSTKDECMTVINIFNKKYKVIIVGNEILPFDYNNYDNVIVSDSLEKTIFYLKKCNFLISNDSGFINFAKNCGVSKVLILRIRMLYHLRFNPFNTTVTSISNIKELNNYV